MAKINYQQVGWDTTKYFNPTNMNHMDDGIKAACDNADSNKESIADVNNKLGNTDISAIGDGTLTGGLDALNSNLNAIETVEWIPSVYAKKIGHTIDIYKFFSGLETNMQLLLGYTIYKPNDNYTIIPVYSTASPYVVIGSMWVGSDGRVLIYKPSETTSCYVSGQYIFK